MKSRTRIVIATLALAVISTAGYGFYQVVTTGASMTAAASKLLASLDEEQKKTTLLDYESEKRVGWHFIPKDERKGLQIKFMNKKQRKLTHDLLKVTLSEAGYSKTKRIMEMEALLGHLQAGKKGPIRDVERYYVTIFGEPGADSKWGLSFEGHHLSLNFVVDNNEVVSSSPQFFATNPGTIQDDYIPEFKKGERVLAKEELLAFELVNALDADQLKVALIAEKAPREIRAAGEAQPPSEEAAGIAVADLNEAQREIMKQLVTEYIRIVPNDVVAERGRRLIEADPKKIHFAWAGATEEGIGHYYRIQGPTFLIEFVNTQPDQAGNPANHVHCVWRDMNGDFDLPIK